METVESATSAIPEAMIEDAEESPRTPPDERAGPEPGEGWRQGERPPLVVETEPEEEAMPVAAQPSTDPWAGLFQTGMALLQQLATASSSGSSTPSGNGAVAPRSLVQRDEQTGETYIKLPVPSPEVVNQALEAFGALLQSFRK